MAVLLAIVALFAAATATNHHVAYAQETVVQTNIIHVSGARTPIVAENTAALCGDAGCGALTTNGAAMMGALGNAMRTRYSALFPASYDPTKLLSRAAAHPRCMQSANAFIKGAYTDASGNYPAVFNEPLLTDDLLVAEAWPSLAFHTASKKDSIDAAVNDVRKRLIDDATMGSIATELGMEGDICDTVGYRSCSLAFYDVAASADAAGTLAGTYPTLSANYASLTAVALANAQQVYNYNSDAVSAIGSSGQPIAQAVTANMEAVLSGNGGANVVVEYSGDASLVSRLGVTVGDTADGIVLPPYGTAIAIELVEEGGSYYVRGVKGSPSGSAGSYTYTPTFLRMGGIGTDGTTYYTTDATSRIPLGDYKRFLASTAGSSSSNAQCAVSSSALQSEGCMAEGLPASELCRSYRANCQQTACPNGLSLNYETLACVRGASSHSPSMTTANAGVMAMCTSFGGMLMGAGAMFAMNHFTKQKQASKGYETVGGSA